MSRLVTLAAASLLVASGCDRASPGLTLGDGGVPEDGEVLSDGSLSDGSFSDGSLTDGGQVDGQTGCSGPLELPFQLQILVDGEDVELLTEGFGAWGMDGDALVTHRRIEDRQTGLTEVGLLDLSDGTEVLIRTVFHNHYQIPVSPGEIAQVFIYVQNPWWWTKDLIIRGQDGDLRCSLHDRDLTIQQPETECWNQSASFCTNAYYQHASFNLDEPELGGPSVFELFSGTVHVSKGAQASFKTILAEAWAYYGLVCEDSPYGWQRDVTLGNSRVSQCTCHDRFDCSSDEVCETVAHRCVENLCLHTSCEEGEWCNPYTGECTLPPPGPLHACETQEDCAQVLDTVCHPYFGVCWYNPCVVMDCLASCSPLLGQCYGCLSDCECQEGEVCDHQSRTCAP